MHASHNCGSMLQAYALQKTLHSMEINNTIINFRSSQQKKMYALLRRPNNLHDILYDAMKLTFYRTFKRHYDDYELFIRKYLTITDKEYSKIDELKELEEQYDAFIAGSDQIWNVLCDDASDAYFLCFVNNKKKIAYAPSFGVTNINCRVDNVQKYRNYIDTFNFLSIRENNGAKWIKELTKRDVEVVLDPTMLMDKKDYIKLVGHSRFENKRYIFYYAFSYSDENNKWVSAVSKKLNLPVMVLDAKSWVKTCRKYGFKLSEHSGPIAFLDLLMNAELVLTTSFHGTALSITTQKKFWFIDSDLHDKDDDRVATILDLFGLENRMVNGKTLLEMSNVLEDWDYQKVSTILEDKRREAISYLRESFSDEL